MDSLLWLISNALKYITRFDPHRKSFLLWQNEFEFVVNFFKVPDNIKARFLLHMVNPSVLKIIAQKVAPVVPFNLPYDILISTLESIFSPYQGLHAVEFRFNIRNQMTRESPVLYAHALRQILIKANPGNLMNTLLLNRFLRGLKCDIAKKHLLQMKTLTLNGAITIAQQIEVQEINKWRQNIMNI
ncbi:hypothetical protein M0804_013728 [Polistes exclamans]|nr:hypothetical protein M0804_013728 [Polistes exclamans]